MALARLVASPWRWALALVPPLVGAFLVAVGGHYPDRRRRRDPARPGGRDVGLPPAPARAPAASPGPRARDDGVGGDRPPSLLSRASIAAAAPLLADVPRRVLPGALVAHLRGELQDQVRGPLGTLDVRRVAGARNHRDAGSGHVGVLLARPRRVRPDLVLDRRRSPSAARSRPRTRSSSGCCSTKSFCAAVGVVVGAEGHRPEVVHHLVGSSKPSARS